MKPITYGITGWAAYICEKSSGLKFFLHAAIFIALIVPEISVAGSFSVSPLRVELSKNSTTAIIQVVNPGTMDTTVQLQTMQWSQVNGEDQLKVTREIIATPQIFNLKAGSTQIVRVGLIKKTDGPLELSYRLILEEIPPPPASDFRGLQVALRISIPIFVKPEPVALPDLQVTTAKLIPGTDQEMKINLHNKGHAHIQLLGLKIFDSDNRDTVLANHEKNIYILPGQRKTLAFNIKAKISTENVVIKASTPSGMMEFNAKPESP